MEKEGKSGKHAISLNYSFPGGKTNGIFSRLRLVKISKPGLSLPGEPLAFKIWVKGDNSGNKLKYRINDGAGRTWIKDLGVLDFDGWKQLECNLSPKGRSWGGKKGAPKDKFIFPLKFAEFSVNPKDDQACRSSISFDKFEVLTRMDAKDYLMVNFKFKEANNLTVNPQISINGDLRNNSTSKSLDLNVQAKLNRLDGTNVFKKDFKIKLAPLERKNQIFDIPLAERGYYDCCFKIDDAKGKDIKETKISVGKIATLSNKEGQANMFGVSLHGASQASLSQMKRLGVTLVRGGIKANWVQLQPNKDKFDFTTADKQAAWSKEAGIQNLIVCGKNPKWLKLAPGQGTDIEAYCNYVRELARHFKGQGYYYEYWNEPDLSSWKGSPAEFGKMAERAYQIIKEEDPSSTVLFASTSGCDFHSGLNNFTLPALKEINNRLPFDVLTVHPYCRPASPDEMNVREKIIAIKKWLLDNGGKGKGLWLGEVGWPTSTDSMGVSEELQAAYLARIFIIGLSVGAGKVIWYKPTSSKDPVWSEMQYGYYRWRGAPKPAALAYSQAAHQLSGKKFDQEIVIVAKQIKCYLFKDDESVIATIYSPGNSDIKMNFPSLDGIKVERFDGYPITNTKEITLSDLPIYFIIPKAKKNVLVNAIEKATITGLDSPIEVTGCVLGNKYNVKISNQINDTLTFPFRIKGENGIVDVPAEYKYGNITLKPFEVKDISLPIYPKKLSRDTIVITANLKKYNLPVYTASFENIKNQEGGQVKWENKVIKLSRENILPADMQHAWKGKDDLSADLKWGWSDQGIHIALIVHDDKHVPEDKVKSLWRGDSIQIGVDISQDGPDSRKTKELGFSIDSKGNEGAWNYTGGNQPPKSQVEYKLKRDDQQKETYYNILIKWGFLGGFKPKINKSIYLSIMINENDGHGRKSYMSLSSGIGGEHFPERYPALIMK